MAYGVVYKITNLINDKIYVGQTIRNPKIRFTEHFRENSYIGKAMRKYGKENFFLETLEECDETKHQLSYRGLAKIMHVSKSPLFLKISGKAKFSNNDISKLVEIFGLPAEYLMKRDDKE